LELLKQSSKQEEWNNNYISGLKVILTRATVVVSSLHKIIFFSALYYSGQERTWEGTHTFFTHLLSGKEFYSVIINQSSK
jgi:hypothetical protein